MIGPRTLFGKLLLLFLSFGALMTGVFLFVMHVSHERYHRESDQRVNRDLARQYVAAGLLLPQSPTAAHPYADALRRISAINPNVDLYVLDERGSILDASIGAHPLVRAHVDLGPVTEFVNGHATFPLLGDDPTDAQHRDVFSAARLSVPGSSAAYLYILLNRPEETAAAGRLKEIYSLSEDAGVVLAATILAFTGSILFLRILTRRFSVLQQDIERFRDDRSVALPAAALADDRAAEDEIERLRRLFVELAERIRAQMQELHKTDDMRRELLANVSHDLRTPLTTLQTHLETLTLKDMLSADEQREYLAVALQQCRRLVRLIDQLLELAKLDARQVPFSPEAFQLAELVQDVVVKSTLAARRVGVTLTMEAPPPDLALVTGDIALIERVLDSLLENAIRFAREGGGVTVRVQREPRSLRVSVHDTGGGIPEAARARVFERFYRGDKSRPSDSGYAGLGLSIARGILELHGRSIDFVSTAEQGTTFFFDLPIASPVSEHNQGTSANPRGRSVA